MIISKNDHSDLVLGQLKTDYSNLFLSPFLTDITIKVKNGSIKAHKIILASRNAVFAKMFSHEMSENIENIVEIDDVDCETFKIFLHYLYSSSILQKDITTNLLIIAGKYMDKTLKTICENYISDNLSLRNAIQCLDIAIHYQFNKLKKTALACIANNWDLVQDLDDFHLIKNNHEAMSSISSLLHFLLINTQNLRSNQDNIIRELIFSMNNFHGFCNGNYDYPKGYYNTHDKLLDVDIVRVEYKSKSTMLMQIYIESSQFEFYNAKIVVALKLSEISKVVLHEEWTRIISYFNNYNYIHEISMIYPQNIQDRLTIHTKAEIKIKLQLYNIKKLKSESK